MDPRAAVRDEEKFSSQEVRQSIETLKKYRANLGEITAALVSFSPLRKPPIEGLFLSFWGALTDRRGPPPPQHFKRAASGLLASYPPVFW